MFISVPAKVPLKLINISSLTTVLLIKEFFTTIYKSKCVLNVKSNHIST